jgi:hypothetical protein
MSIGPEPLDYRSCVVEPTHMGVAGGETAIRQSELGAVCRLTDKDPVVVFPKLGEIRQNKSQALPKLATYIGQ